VSPLKIAVYTIALNEAAHAERWANSATDADYRIVADTGSTDDTVDRLTKAGVIVHRIAIRPWRFDDARNAAMALIPADVDVCCTMDMDRFLEPGWRPKLEAAWTPDTTALCCRTVYRARPDDSTILRGWSTKNFHHRWGYRFKRPVHEALVFTGEKEVTRDCADIVMCEVQDLKKGTRQQYLPLMELAHKEDPNDSQICFWLSREFMWANRHAEASALLERYLNLQASTWSDERAEAMRYLAQMQPEKKMLWLDKARMEAPHRREIWLDLAEELHSKENWLNLFWACTNGIEKTRRTNSYLDDNHCWGFRLFDLGAIAAWHLNAMDRAVEWAQKALALDTNNQRLKNNLDFFLRRQAEIKGGATPKEIFWNISFARRAEINETISKNTGNLVASGPFVGMKIPSRSTWGDGDIAPKLLGTYEQELHEALLKLRSRSYGAVINIGCAEGYYAVGLARLNPTWRIYAFDTDPTAQQMCRTAAEANGVAGQIVIQGHCTTEELKSLAKKYGALLCLIDCEGHELKLLTPFFIEESGFISDFIVECHDFLVPGTTPGLQQRFQNTHNVRVIRQGARDPNKFDFLAGYTDTERWLAVSEMRRSAMNWLVCEAKRSDYHANLGG